MNEKPLEEAAQILARGVGLRVDPTIRSRLTRAVRDEAAARGLDLAEYVTRLDADPDALQDLLNRVTVQETSFFRDPGQFTALAEHVLPALRDRGGPVIVWSAGCANGQEPYSLAMALAESGIADWRVVATDISTRALARTKEARYRESEITGLSPSRRAAHLERVEGEGEPPAWEVVASLRDRVTVARHNLAADPPPFEPDRCDVVFCRNVLIYFGHDDIVAVIDRLASWLPASAYVFLGYSESLWQVSDRFQVQRVGPAFVYRKASPAGAASVPATPVRPRTKKVPARAAPVPSAVPAPVAVPVPVPTSVELLASGEAAFEAGDHQGAIAAFRKATFVDPDHPIAHLNLGLALEASGDADAARRAYAATRAALDRCDSAVVEATLEGYHLGELRRLLDMKVGQG